MPVTINLSSVVRGDKWQGIPSIGPILVNGLQPSDILSRIRIQFRKNGVLGMTLDSESSVDRTGLIVISNATTWLAHIPALQPLPLEAGDWKWDAEFYAGTDTAPLTYYKGVLTVTGDETLPPA